MTQKRGTYRIVGRKRGIITDTLGLLIDNLLKRVTDETPPTWRGMY